MHGHNLGVQTDMEGNFSLLLPSDAMSLDISYVGYESRNDESSGLVKWNLTLDPTSNKELRMSYAVKYPSKERVILE